MTESIRAAERPATRGRAGLAFFTLVALATTGLVVMTTVIQHQLRHGADRVIAHRIAVSEAVALAESALEESLFTLRHRIAATGSLEMRPGAAIRIDAKATARLARACGEDRITLRPVTVQVIGPVIRDAAGVEGAIELTAAACVRPGVFLGAEVSRRAVRRYRWSQVDLGGTRPEAPCLELLVQWVAP